MERRGLKKEEVGIREGREGGQRRKRWGLEKGFKMKKK